MNCDHCNKSALLQFEFGGNVKRACSRECAVTLIEGKRETSKITAYYAFPESEIPYEFKNAPHDPIGRPYAPNSVMRFLGRDLTFYADQSIDHESSLIIAVVFSPVIVMGVNTMGPVAASGAQRVAQSNFDRIRAKVQQYGKAAKHVGILRFFDRKYAAQEREDRDKMNDILRAADIRYIPYSTEQNVYGNVRRTTVAGNVLHDSIQTATRSLIDDASKEHGKSELKFYVAFPEENTPRQFYRSEQDLRGVKEWPAFESIMGVLKHGQFDVYSSFKDIDYETSVIAVVLLSPFLGKYDSDDSQPKDFAQHVAERNYETVRDAVRRYGKVAKYVGVVRFHDSRFAGEKDEEYSMMYEVRDAVRGDADAIRVYYVPYQIKVYKRNGDLVRVAEANNARIQKAIWAVDGDAHRAATG